MVETKGFIGNAKKTQSEMKEKGQNTPVKQSVDDSSAMILSPLFAVSSLLSLLLLSFKMMMDIDDDLFGGRRKRKEKNGVVGGRKPTRRR